MRNRPWLGWTAGQLLAFVGVLLIVDVGLGVLFSGHGEAMSVAGRIVHIALAAAGLYVIFSWARSNGRSRNTKP